VAYVAFYNGDVPFKRSSLLDDEVVVVEVRQHWSVVFPTVASAVVFLAAVTSVGVVLAPLPLWTLWIAFGVVVLPVLRAGLGIFHWFRHTITLTSQRIVVQRGGFSQDQTQLHLDRACDVGFRQSILDRVLGRGAVVVELDEGDTAVFLHLRRPRAFAHVVTAELSLRRSGSPLDERELADSVAELTSGRRSTAVAAASEIPFDYEEHAAPDVDRATAALPPLARTELEVLLGQFEDGEISAAQFERQRFALFEDYGIDPRSSR